MSTVLPFEAIGYEQDASAERDAAARYETLPPELKAAAEGKPHLQKYLKMLPVEQIGIPAFQAKLSRDMGELKDPNVIYPVDDRLFVHILADPKDNRNCYIPIEPSLLKDTTALVEKIEKACIEHGDKLPEFDIEADREKQLMGYIDMVTSPARAGSAPEPEAVDKKNKKGRLVKIRVTPQELAIIKYLFVRDKIGMGELEPLAGDPYIEDISCAGLGPLFIEHKVFKSLKCSITFLTMEELDNFVLRLGEKLQKPLSYTDPIADSTLSGGARINIVYGSEVSKRGSNFTIRHFSQVPTSIFELVNFGTINYQMLAYLALAISNGMNLFVSGESASGKTTMLNALTVFIHPLSKIITIEDTPELQVPHANWIREVVQTTRANDTSGAVTTFDLLRAALRQRPNEILVGEIRGPEGNVAFQAMQTGHSVMTTFHASTVEKLIQRITASPILVPKTYIDNLNVVVVMSSVKLPNGKFARRVISISEIVGYDSLTDSFNIVEVFNRNEDTDRFIFTGYMSSFILESKIAPRLGIASSKKAQVYVELEKRAKILENLHLQQKVTGFYEILDILGKAQREGLF